MKNASMGCNNDPTELNWKLRLPPEPFVLLMPMDQQAMKRVTVLSQVIDPDNHGKIGIPTQ